MSEVLSQPPVSPTPKDKTREKFIPTIYKPYDSFVGGKPVPIPYLIQGLAAKAAFSVLGAKGKHGKSSMSRIEAVCVSKGQPFLSRATEQGEVLLCSLEDPKQHVDNCLHALGYDQGKDAQIYVTYQLSRNFLETVDWLNDTLAKLKDVKLVILDTLGKTIRATKTDSYDEMLQLCEHLRDISRSTGVHVQALGHCKKVLQEDPFDNFMGSAEVRNSTDTNLVIFDKLGKRWLQSEGRMCVPWEATELCAELEVIDDTQMVKQIYFADTLAKSTKELKAAQEKLAKDSNHSRLVRYLREHGGQAKYIDYINDVSGRTETKNQTVSELLRSKPPVIRLSGIPKSPINPQIIHLIEPTFEQSEPVPPVSDTINKVPEIPYEQWATCSGCGINKIAGESFNSTWGANFCSEACTERGNQ